MYRDLGAKVKKEMLKICIGDNSGILLWLKITEKSLIYEKRTLIISTL